jgi:hypothetical protein
MSRGRWKREHELPSFPFHCYTNPGYTLGHALGRLSRGLVRLCQRIWAAGEDVSWQAS